MSRRKKGSRRAESGSRSALPNDGEGGTRTETVVKRRRKRRAASKGRAAADRVHRRGGEGGRIEGTTAPGARLQLQHVAIWVTQIETVPSLRPVDYALDLDIRIVKTRPPAVQIGRADTERHMLLPATI